MKNLTVNKFSLFLITVFLIIAYIYREQCVDIVFLEYLKHYFFDIGRVEGVAYQIQFVNEGVQGKHCYFTLNEKYFDVYENRYLYITYFPRTARVIFNQLIIFLIVSFVLLRKKRVMHDFKSINLQFLVVAILGLVISIFSINRTINSFESSFMLYLFVVFSILKCFILFQYLEQNKFHLTLLLLSCFPFISTGFGIPWLFDFFIYYTLFSIINAKKYKKENLLLLVLISLALSLIYPTMNSPSIEMQIANEEFKFEEVSNFNEISQQRNTFLETEDLVYLSESQFEDQIGNEVFNFSRYLKDVKYPGRYMYLISIFPDIQYHIPALIWYFALIVLFFNIFQYLKTEKLSNLVPYIENSAKLLIFYQLISIFLGINTFFNSFSNFLFSLSRNAELITFGINQTWRGIASHYEMFSNLQLISFCFFLLTYFLTRKNIYLIFTLVSIYSTFLSQSRWNTLLVFILLFVLLINSYRQFPKQIILLFIFSIFVTQNIPVFEREEPFFIYQDGIETQYKHDQSYSLGFIEPLTDRLNRTLPWKMFASGYEPNIVSLSFGHGPAGYLNIVKNSETMITSGPHSSLILILNKFGLFGVSVSLIIAYLFVKESYKKLHIKYFIYLMFTSLLMISLEIKTDSLLLMDGVAVFFFNLFVLKLFQKIAIEINSNRN